MSEPRITEVQMHATSGIALDDGRRRPTSFTPYVVAEGWPSIPAEHPYRSFVRPGRRGDCALYFRECGGVAEFFLHDPRDQAGYGGAEFSGVLESGEAFAVRGPWSSSCQTINALGITSEPLAPIAVRRPDEAYMWRQCHTGVSLLRRVETWLAPHWRLEVPGVAIAPRSADMADEQVRVVEGPNPIPHFVPARDLEDCAGCVGRGYNLGGPCAACSASGKNKWGGNCFECHGRGRDYVPCEVCGRRFCDTGVAPYPHLRLANHFPAIAASRPAKKRQKRAS